ncbi:hypothetical protein THAOC_36752 [Thalassiosira oceanica]|uniref:Uncharacterized protein n=1 Tax=Thalassiosira oceanica TaxID=159749 RepID=K0QZQ9_THAOC|nr:hypothetical protein THAOC_36752 [Thalassiosira oceanica]|eukprot:EJK44690.1 hypothetical protein THAOC_36752 [Thalassiosira oceanica]
MPSAPPTGLSSLELGLDSTPQVYAYTNREHEHETGFPQLAAGEIASDRVRSGAARVGTASYSMAVKEVTRGRLEDETDDISPGGTSRQSGRSRTTVCSPPGSPSGLDDISPGGTSRQSGRSHTTVCSPPGSPSGLAGLPDAVPQPSIKVCKSLMRQQLDDSNSVPRMSEGLDIESDDEDGNDKDVMVPRPTVLGDSHEDIRGDIHGGREEEKEREIELETRRSTRRTARDKEDHQRRTCQGGQPPRPRRAGAAAPALVVGEQASTAIRPQSTQPGQRAGDARDRVEISACYRSAVVS